MIEASVMLLIGLNQSHFLSRESQLELTPRGVDKMFNDDLGLPTNHICVEIITANGIVVQGMWAAIVPIGICKNYTLNTIFHRV